MASKAFFITGTDTEVGKTYISSCMLKMFSKAGFSTLGMKPVSTGGFIQNNITVNEDALILQQYSTIQAPYQKINPFSFLSPVSLNIAANNQLNSTDIAAAITDVLQYKADVTLIEGVGGWHAPINYTETMATVVQKAKLPVIMVVSIKLGCLNHAILTHNAIKNSGLPMIGWVANCLHNDTLNLTDNIITLEKLLASPLLGVVKYQGELDQNLGLLVKKIIK